MFIEHSRSAGRHALRRDWVEVAGCDDSVFVPLTRQGGAETVRPTGAGARPHARAGGLGPRMPCVAAARRP